MSFPKSEARRRWKRSDFLSSYCEIVVHGFLASYFKKIKADQAMCFAHLLRELTGVFENHLDRHGAVTVL